MKKKMDYNSVTNQDIKRRFVEREVLACFSYEMESVLRSGENYRDKEYPLPTYEEIENLYEYKCPECGNGFPIEEEAKSCCDSKDEPENETQEILEWWIVTEWLAKKLSAKGQPVLEWGNNWYWGRTCSGQAILLDGVISEICSEMEILESQTNDWSKHK